MAHGHKDALKSIYNGPMTFLISNLEKCEPSISPIKAQILPPDKVS
jgi:hypothetical protein